MVIKLHKHHHTNMNFNICKNNYDNVDIQTMIQTYLNLIRPNAFCYSMNSLEGKVRMLVDQKFYGNIGYYILPNILDDHYDYLGMNIYSKIKKPKFKSCDIIKIHVDKKEINDFLEALGKKLYYSDYCYNIRTMKSKRYGDVIIPLFFENGYEIKEHVNFIEEKNNKINSTFVEYNLTYDDKDMIHGEYKFLNPFGFFNDNKLFMLKTKVFCKNGHCTYDVINLNLSDKSKEGFSKISITYPY